MSDEKKTVRGSKKIVLVTFLERRLQHVWNRIRKWSFSWDIIGG